MQETLFRRQFLERVEVDPGGCWIWKGYTIRNRSGQAYGRLKRCGKNHLAHRFAFAQVHGPIPPGLVVRHRCDKTLCVNPDHLEVGTHKDNAHDRESRGRGNHPSGASHYKSSLTASDVSDIRDARGTVAVRTLAATYGVAHNTIVQIQNRERWNDSA
ncbi:HNH endonuclease signature motif containing protein [Rubrivirga sp.]|uniref:HNH endonuclease signature motif containing protein n=1 Tax=Rubrivirga sp. TaxID=1885344 RepID=UPI003B528D05